MGILAFGSSLVGAVLAITWLAAVSLVVFRRRSAAKGPVKRGRDALLVELVATLFGVIAAVLFLAGAIVESEACLVAGFTNLVAHAVLDMGGMICAVKSALSGERCGHAVIALSIAFIGLMVAGVAVAVMLGPMVVTAS